MSSNSDHNPSNSDDDNDSVVILFNRASSQENLNLPQSSEWSSRFESPTDREYSHEVAYSDEADEVDDTVASREDWANLPELPIDKIYSFLSRTDQTRMSLVCQRWSKEYGSPIIWKTIKFYLPEYEYSSDIYPEVKFAEKYGVMFKHVEIHCKRVRSRLLGVIFEQLKKFLAILSVKSQLSSIQFTNMKNYFRVLDHNSRPEILNAINILLKSQKSLKKVELLSTGLFKEEGIEMLMNVFHEEANQLSHLVLKNFAKDNEETIPESDAYSENIQAMSRKFFLLNTLEVDYNQIFEDLLNCHYLLCQQEKTSQTKNPIPLSRVKIYCEGSKCSNYEGILPGAWNNIFLKAPDLKVNMEIKISSNFHSETNKFLVSNIPLQSLEYTFDKPYNTARLDLNMLFRHLLNCNYNEHLETLNIVWLPPIADLPGTVLPFIQSCKKIRTFHLHAKYKSSGIEDVLKGLLDNRPASLQSITLWFTYSGNENADITIPTLSEEYYPIFQLLGIELFLLLDPGRRLRRRA